MRIRKSLGILIATALALALLPAALGEVENVKESPMLAERVGAGALEPLSERLPAEPKLANGFDSTQFAYDETPVYGGAIRIGTVQENSSGDFNNVLWEPFCNSPGLLGKEYTPAIFRSFEPNADFTVYTAKLREGMRWSDGEFVTTEDIRFTVEDILLRENSGYTFPDRFRDGGSAKGEKAAFAFIDDYTFTITFSVPYPGLIRKFALMGANYDDILKPAHYLKRFHVDHADPDAYAALLAEAGYTAEEWYLLLADKDITQWEMCFPNAVDFPTLASFVLKSRDSALAVFERNPYYWKVDKDGRQLPYIDRAEVVFLSDTEILNNMLLSGDLDFSRESPSIAKLPLYIENEPVGDYTTYIWTYHGRLGNLYLNQSYDADADWFEFVNKPEFRQAIGCAIDRAQILDTVFYGLGTPASQFGSGEYDSAKANALLDGLGLDQRGADGYRLYPSGNPVSLVISVSQRVPENAPICEMEVEMLQEVGIKAMMNEIDNSLLTERRSANMVQAMIERHEAYWFKADMKFIYWCPNWNAYLTTNGASGTEPPEDVKRLFQFTVDIGTLGDAEAYAAYENMVAMQQANLYYIPIMDATQFPLIMSNRLGNTNIQNATSMLVNFNLYELYLKAE